MGRPKVFISYAHSDEDSRQIAEALRGRLKAADCSVFEDASQIEAGALWQERIEKALEQAETFILLLSPRSLSSPWANFEIGVAASRARASSKVQVIPVLLADTNLEDLPPMFPRQALIDVSRQSSESAAEKIANAVVAVSG